MDQAKPAKRRKSTNPFDSSSDEEESAPPVDVFHDCHDVLGKKREAKLDFNFRSGHVVGKID